ncbi:MAG: acyltransferase, partial [Promethearchaeota archaeon]
HWNARRIIKKFPAWLSTITPFPWMRGRYVLNQLGASIGKNVCTLFSWIDLEFVTVEDDTVLGRGAMISSHYFFSDKLIIKAVTVKKNVIIGDRVRINPGTTVGEGTILIAKAVTRMDEKIPSNAVYGGNPAKRLKL